MPCDVCGSRQVASILAQSQMCEDGRQVDTSLQLCSACAESRDPRASEKRRARARSGYARIFDEMRATLAEQARSADGQTFALTKARAAEWLAGVDRLDASIEIPEDLQYLLER